MDWQVRRYGEATTFTHTYTKRSLHIHPELLEDLYTFCRYGQCLGYIHYSDAHRQ